MARGTKEEEARKYLEELGLDIDAIPKKGAVPSIDEMVEEFTKALYEQKGELKGIALVNGLKALATLSEAKQDEEEDTGPDLTVDEILADAGLPDARKVEIADAELLRLRERTEGLRRLRDGLTESTVV